jgi:hypothetical protein
VVAVKSIIIWDITPCSPLKGNRRFGRKISRNLQDREKDEQETSVKAELGLFFDPEDGGDFFLQSFR